MGGPTPRKRLTVTRGGKGKPASLPSEGKKSRTEIRCREKVTFSGMSRKKKNIVGRASWKEARGHLVEFLGIGAKKRPRHQKEKRCPDHFLIKKGFRSPVPRRRGKEEPSLAAAQREEKRNHLPPLSMGVMFFCRRNFLKKARKVPTPEKAVIFIVDMGGLFSSEGRFWKREGS